MPTAKEVSKDIEYKITRLSPDPGDVLLLTLNVVEADLPNLEDVIANLSEMLVQRGVNCPLIVLGKDSKLSLLCENDLSHLGLYRKESINSSNVDKLYK